MAVLNRRTFLSTSAIAATSLVTTRHLFSTQPTTLNAPTQSRRFPIYKSLKFPMVGEPGTVLQRFQLLAELGFDGVEIDSPDQLSVAELLEASSQTGLPIHGCVDSTHWKMRASDPDPATREKCLEDLLTAIQTSNAVGGSSVLFVPGHAKDGDWETIAPRIHEVISNALPTAAKLGIHILIENVWNQLFYDHTSPPEQSAERYAAFIDSFHSPWVGAYFDIGNHHKYAQPQEWIRQLGSRIVKLDVKGFDRATGKFSPITLGTINWPAVRDALDEIGFTGWCTAELGGGNKDYLAGILNDLHTVLPN